MKEEIFQKWEFLCRFWTTKIPTQGTNSIKNNAISLAKKTKD